jgi:hypothetical protein
MEVQRTEPVYMRPLPFQHRRVWWLVRPAYPVGPKILSWRVRSYKTAARLPVRSMYVGEYREDS